MKFIEDSKEIAFDWIGDIRFGLVFGRDRSDNESIVRKVMEGTYKACNSKIHFKDGKLFLLLCVDIPIVENKLNEDICVGVDLGIKVPVYVAVNNSLERKSLGSIDSFLNFRKQIQKRRRSLQSDLALGASGGKGRTKKLKALDSFKDFEKNWCTTYNHQITSQVIKFAIDNGAGTIKLEFLKGYPSNDNKFLTRNWSYFQVQSMIEYKAKKNGIKVLYIDPYHTSQECSCCGHYEKGQRINQATFKCKNESCKAFDKDVNADYNAALNISRSTKEVSDVKDTIYYSIKKQLKEVA
jgi:IS605 OrfB family transposase